MALPNNNAYPNGPGQGPGSQGPAQTGPKQTKNPLQDLIDDLAKGKLDIRDIAKIISQIGEAMQKVQGTAEATRKVYKEHSNELRAQVAFQDEVVASTKKIADLQRRMVREGKPPDLKSTLSAYREMEKLSKAHQDKGMFSKKQSDIMKKNMAEIRAEIKKLSSGAADAFDTEDLDKFIVKMGRLNRDTLSLAKNMKGVRLSTLAQDSEAARKAFQHVFQGTDRTTKYREYAAKATKIREAHALHVQGKHEHAKARREDILKQIPRHNLRTKNFKKADGTHDKEAYEAAKSGHLAKHAEESARNRGYGRLGSRLFAKSVVDTKEGKTPGVLNRMGMNVLARGEGSIGRGIASIGFGALEGGLSSVAEAAGPLAPILALGEVIKLAFDKNATMNAEAAEKLGGSGIYGSGGSPIDSLQQVRSNLNGPLYSQLGIGYQKNLEIASAMQQAGFSNQSLTSKGMNTDDRGMLSGSFGSMQRNVYGFGRMAGMDPSQTMAQTLKLVTIYKQSLVSTEDFFVRINKDTRMAGMSTMKYIELIDEVNSHYSRSNKLIEATVDTMRLLSVTGRSTAEDLKEAMDAATSGGAKRSPEVKAYLAGEMFRDPDMVRRLQGGADLSLQRSVDNVGNAFKPYNTNGEYSSDKLQKRIEEGGINAFIQMGVEAKTKATGSDGVVDSAQLKSMNDALQAAEKAFRVKKAMDYDAGLNNPSRSGLAYSMQGSMMGEDILSQKALTAQSIIQAMHLSGMKVGDTLDATKQAAISGDPRLNMSLTALGTDPEKAFTFINELVRTSAQASAQLAKGGMGNVDPMSPDGKDQHEFLEKMYGMVEQDGGFKNRKNMTGDHILDLQNLAGEDGGQAKIIAALSKHESTLLDVASNSTMAKMMRPIVTQLEKNTDLDKATQVSSGTRTTADIWADAFASFFNRLQTPLNLIAKLMSSSPLFGNGSLATQSDMFIADRINQSPEKVTKQMALDTHVQELEYQRTHPKTGVTDEETERQLTEAKSARDAFGRVTDEVGMDSGLRGMTSQGDVLALQNADAYAAALLRQQVANAPTGSPSVDAQSKMTASGVLSPSSMQSNPSSKPQVSTYNYWNSVGFVTLEQQLKSSLNDSGETTPLRKAK